MGQPTMHRSDSNDENAAVMAQSHRHIPELDGLRGLSILLVIYYHGFRYQGTNSLGQVADRLAHLGWCGVDVFFVLSGFLITGILLNTRTEPNYWWNFLIRRGLRIFPLYYAVLTAVLIAGWSISRWGIAVEDPALQALNQIWINYLYLTNFAMAISGDNSVPLDIAWSLAIEEQFYLVFPALVFFLRLRTLTTILFVVLVAAPVFRALVWWYGPHQLIGPSVLPFCRMDALAAGALVSLALKSGHIEKVKILARIAPIALVLAIGALLAWTRAELPFVVLGYSLNIAASVTLLARLLISPDSAWLRKLFRNSALVYLGKISYGLYLLHLIARAIVSRCLASFTSIETRSDLMGSLLQFACMTLLAILLATVSYYLFESPILRLKDRWAPSSSRRQFVPTS
jgi:peptidoglycan/LPS O-acetylase OafA/YrhL